MNIDGLLIFDETEKRQYTAQEIIAVLDGGGGLGSRDPARTTMTASYATSTVSPTVHYTALNPDGTILTARRTSGVSLSACGDYTYVQAVTGVDQFVAVWDEGDALDYVIERIMVDT